MRKAFKYALVALTAALNATTAWGAVSRIWTFQGSPYPSANLLYNNGAVYGAESGGETGAGDVFQLTPPAQAGDPWTRTVIYNGFYKTPYARPESISAVDNNGALYGTQIDISGGCPSVYQLAPPAAPGGTWTYTIIYGYSPNSPCPYDMSVTLQNGVLYGTALYYPGPSSPPGMIFELTPPAAGSMWNLITLYTFTGGSDGGSPGAYLAFDSAGTMYGTTWLGGSAAYPNGDGTVFQLTPPTVAGTAWTETTLYTFAGPDGWQPTEVAFGPNGALYGITNYGGGPGCSGNGHTGCGTVFQLSPPAEAGGAWTESVLYSFSGGSDGSLPNGIVIAPDGTIYGGDYSGLFQVTYTGGAWVESPIANVADIGNVEAPPILDPQGDLLVASLYTPGTAVVFQVAPPSEPGGAWTPTVLYNSAQFDDGETPFGPLASDSKGAIYGATCGGGSAGNGTVYKLTPPAQTGQPWSEAILYSFSGSGGGSPCLGVVRGKNGYLYGAATGGGEWGQGVVFRLAPPATPGGAWTETVLHSFGASGDPGFPTTPLVLDDNGALYGASGYTNGIDSTGVIYQLTPPSAPGGAWTETILTAAHGAIGLALKNGTLYGTARSTSDFGSVFQLSPPAVAGGAWTETLLHLFLGGRDGAYPAGPLVFDSNGALFGTTSNGGKTTTGGPRDSGCGVVYQLTPTTGGGPWKEKILFDFGNGACRSGTQPTALVFNKGVLYGSNCGNPDSPSPRGILFRLRLSGTETRVGTTVWCPQSLSVLSKGAMYGVSSDGSNGFGLVFQLTP